jgi:hypothetical protein
LASSIQIGVWNWAGKLYRLAKKVALTPLSPPGKESLDRFFRNRVARLDAFLL